MKTDLNNFSFIKNGEEFWWSRSIACISFVFCKNENDTLCVLANKRGPGAPNQNGKWNCPCGYLDTNEGLKECASRETFEETGIMIDPSSLRMFRIDDSSESRTQNVSISFTVLLSRPTSEYEFDLSRTEPGEVEDVMFIPIDEIDNYTWAFGHDKIIKDIISGKFNEVGEPYLTSCE